MPHVVVHPLPPLYDSACKVLLLGTMPSPRSRAEGFYYAHPQNRFWPVLSAVLGAPLPRNNQERAALCLDHHIALWDVLHACTIQGASDSSIRDAVPNDLRPLLAAAPVQAIFTTGTKAASLYRRYCEPQTQRPAQPLPSPSAANCRMHTLETLVEAYKGILGYLK